MWLCLLKLKEAYIHEHCTQAPDVDIYCNQEMKI